MGEKFRVSKRSGQEITIELETEANRTEIIGIYEDKQASLTLFVRFVESA